MILRLSIPLNNRLFFWHCEELHWQYGPQHPVRDVLEGIVKCQNWIDWALVKNTNSIYFCVLMLRLQLLTATERGQRGKWQHCWAGQVIGEILGKDSSSGRIWWPPEPRSQTLQHHKWILNSNSDLLNSVFSCATFSLSNLHLLNMPF